MWWSELTSTHFQSFMKLQFLTTQHSNFIEIPLRWANVFICYTQILNCKILFSKAALKNVQVQNKNAQPMKAITHSFKAPKRRSNSKTTPKLLQNSISKPHPHQSSPIPNQKGPTRQKVVKFVDPVTKFFRRPKNWIRKITPTNQNKGLVV